MHPLCLEQIWNERPIDIRRCVDKWYDSVCNGSQNALDCGHRVFLEAYAAATGRHHSLHSPNDRDYAFGVAITLCGKLSHGFSAAGRVDDAARVALLGARLCEPYLQQGPPQNAKAHYYHFHAKRAHAAAIRRMAIEPNSSLKEFTDQLKLLYSYYNSRHHFGSSEDDSSTFSEAVHYRKCEIDTWSDLVRWVWIWCLPSGDVSTLEDKRIDTSHPQHGNVTIKEFLDLFIRMVGTYSQQEVRIKETAGDSFDRANMLMFVANDQSDSIKKLSDKIVEYCLPCGKRNPDLALTAILARLETAAAGYRFIGAHGDSIGTVETALYMCPTHFLNVQTNLDRLM